MNAEPIFELREKYKDCHLGIMVAGFREQKDQKTLIRAYNELPENYHLLLAGSGVLEEECKQLAKNLGTFYLWRLEFYIIVCATAFTYCRRCDYVQPL